MTTAGTHAFGNAIRNKRKQKRLVQRQACELLDVSPSTLHRWEAGTHRPDREAYDKIAAFLEVPVDRVIDLLSGRSTDERAIEHEARLDRIENHLGLPPFDMQAYLEAE